MTRSANATRLRHSDHSLLGAGATLLPRASAGRYAALPTPQAQLAGPSTAEAATDVLRAIFDPKLNEGTLAGQATEFMSLMSHKVRYNRHLRAGLNGLW